MDRVVDKSCAPDAMIEEFIADVLVRDNIELVSCTSSTHQGTFPAKIIKCKLNGGQDLNLLYKYAPEGSKRFWAIEYETNIYKTFLDDIPLSTVDFYGGGNFENGGKNQRYLITEYLNDSELLTQKEPAAFAKAAEWIAAFHNHFELSIFKNVEVYDKQFYSSLIEAISMLAEKLNSKMNCLSELCNYFLQNVELLVGAPQTLIHGEYYGKNILVKNDVIYPVDWETAAKGPGEIDLAALVDRKDSLRSAYAIESYKNARWNGQKIPPEFERRFLLARIFYQFKWIVDWRIGAAELSRWFNDSNYYEAWQQLSRDVKCN